MLVNKLDVTRVVPESADKWQDVVLASEFIHYAHRQCLFHGKHRLIAISELNKVANSFIGREISDTAFKAAIVVFSTLERSKFKRGNMIKFSPLDRLEEYKEQWKQHQRIAEIEMTDTPARTT